MMFSYFCSNIDCGYTLEPPRQGIPQCFFFCCFFFFYIKVEFKGVCMSRTCFPDVCLSPLYLVASHLVGKELVVLLFMHVVTVFVVLCTFPPGVWVGILFFIVPIPVPSILTIIFIVENMGLYNYLFPENYFCLTTVPTLFSVISSFT